MYLLRFCQNRILPHLWCPQSQKPGPLLTPTISTCSLLVSTTLPLILPGLCHDFHQFSTFFLLSPKHPLIQLCSTMTCFHIPYLILSHVPFLLILSFIFSWSFRLEGKLGDLGLLRLETFGPEEDIQGTIYFGAMSSSSPTRESTQVVATELILSWTSSQVNSGSGSILSNNVPSSLGNPTM